VTYLSIHLVRLMKACKIVEVSIDKPEIYLGRDRLKIAVSAMH